MIARLLASLLSLADRRRSPCQDDADDESRPSTGKALLPAVAPHPTRLFRALSRPRRKPEPTSGSWLDRQSAAATRGNRRGGRMKMVLIVRDDAGMRTGKVASQAAHAAVGVYKAACEGRRSAVCDAWEATGAMKIVLRITGASALARVAANARRRGLPVTVVRDAGRTQVKQGTMTAVGLGPGNAHDIDQVAGSLRLF